MAGTTESYTPKKLSASGSVFTGSGTLGGIFCTTDGTVQVTDSDDVEIIPVFSVIAGMSYLLPMTVPNGIKLVLSSAAVVAFWAAP